MGRRTFESIGRPLPGRRNLVLSRSSATALAGVESVADIGQALELCRDAQELCVIGGAQAYALALTLAERIYLTCVHAQVDGDVRFPPFDRQSWRELERREHPADARHFCDLSFLTLERA
jgi:dihydrofolate reductase